MRSISLQRADPIGALAGWRLTVTASAAVAGLAVVLTLASAADITDWTAAVSALWLIAIAATMLSVRAHPRRGPLTRAWTVAILGFALGGHYALIASTWGAPPDGGEWGPYAIALLLLALIPYRPAAEMVIATLVSAVWVVAATLAQQSSAGMELASLAAVEAVTPVLALPLGGLAFAAHILGFLERWRESAVAATDEEARRQEVAITRAVQQTRVSILNRDVVPFYSELIAAGGVDEVARARAAELAASIRAVMLADTERSWLDDLITTETSSPTDPRLRTGVRDSSALARHMDLDQRTALRALVDAIRELPGGADTVIGVSVHPADLHCEAILSASVRCSRRKTMTALRPYLAVMSAVFSDFAYEFRYDRLTVRFCYDRA